MDPRLESTITSNSGMPINESQSISEPHGKECLELGWNADKVSKQVFDSYEDSLSEPLDFDFDDFSFSIGGIDFNNDTTIVRNQITIEQIDFEDEVSKTKEAEVNEIDKEADTIKEVANAIKQEVLTETVEIMTEALEHLDELSIYKETLKNNYLFDDNFELLSLLTLIEGGVDFESLDLSKRARIDPDKLELIIPRNSPYFREGQVHEANSLKLTVRYETEEEEQEFNKAWEGFIQITKSSRAESKEEIKEEKEIDSKKNKLGYKEKNYNSRLAINDDPNQKNVVKTVAKGLTSNYIEEQRKMEESKEKKHILNEEIEKEERQKEVKKKAINSHIREMDFQIRSNNARDERLQELVADLNRPIIDLPGQHKTFKFPLRKAIS